MFNWQYLLIALLSGLLAIIVALCSYRKVMEADEGDQRMREVSQLIQNGANSFIKIQYRILMVFTLILAVLIAVVFGNL